jgi:hypothetical protein
VDASCVFSDLELAQFVIARNGKINAKQYGTSLDYRYCQAEPRTRGAKMFKMK